MSFLGLGGGSSPDRSYLRDYKAAKRNLNTVTGNYATEANRAGAERTLIDPQFRQAWQERVATLRSDPYTDSYRTMRTGQATAGVNEAYNRAKANLASEMARRGLSADASAFTGGTAGIEAARAGSLSNAAFGVAQDAIADRERRAREELQLLGGLRNDARSAETGAWGAQANIQQGLMSNSGQMWQAEQARADAANQNSFLNTLGRGLAGGLGQGFGTDFGNALGQEAAPSFSKWLRRRFVGAKG